MLEDMPSTVPTSVAGVDTHDRALLAKKFFELQQKLRLESYLYHTARGLQNQGLFLSNILRII
jgi:hypothetical protein